MIDFNTEYYWEEKSYVKSQIKDEEQQVSRWPHKHPLRIQNHSCLCGISEMFLYTLLCPIKLRSDSYKPISLSGASLRGIDNMFLSVTQHLRVDVLPKITVLILLYNVLSLSFTLLPLHWLSLFLSCSDNNMLSLFFTQAGVLRIKLFHEFKHTIGKDCTPVVQRWTNAA